jgi:hypothetical protein
MILGLLLGFGWFLFYLGGHILIIRYATNAIKPRLSQQLLIVGLVCLIGSIAAAPSVVGSHTLLHGGWPMGVAWGVLTYLGLFCLYTPFYYVVVSSLSVQTLVMLLEKPANRLSLSALREVFASREFVRQRLMTMQANGFVQRQGQQHFALTAKGQRLAAFFSWLKQFWKLGPGG